MEPFITFKDTDKSGELQYYILQRAYPHFQGVILTLPKEGAIAEAVVPEYNLFVSYAGTISGNYILSKRDIDAECQFVMQQMADWFYNNRVLKEPKKYKKFKHVTMPIKQCSSPS